jgi:hypothetical protein
MDVWGSEERAKEGVRDREREEEGERARARHDAHIAQYHVVKEEDGIVANDFAAALSCWAYLRVWLVAIHHVLCVVYHLRRALLTSS